MAQISLRIEDDVKKNAEQACADIGISLSTAINISSKNWDERSVYHLRYLWIRFIRGKIWIGLESLWRRWKLQAAQYMR